MKRKSIYFLIALWAFSISCEQRIEDQQTTLNDVPQEIILKLQQAGFHTEEGLMRFKDGYLVEYDIFLTANDIDKLSDETKVSKNGRTEHYRTNELVAANPERIVRVFLDPTLGLFTERAFIEALARYNNLNLRITFQAVANPAVADINIVPFTDHRPILGVSGTPFNGDPAPTIGLNTRFYNPDRLRGDATTVIAHEIGHAIGFRHTDFMDTRFSCSAGSRESDGEIGVVHIPGTPTGPSGNSWMLACLFVPDRPFTAEDVIALNALYGRFTHVQERWATQVGVFLSEQQWAIGDFNGDDRPDFASVFSDGGAASLNVYPNTGSGFGMSRWATQQGAFTNEQKWVAGDFNADGKTDFAKAFNDGGLTSIDVHLSNGFRFDMQRFATQQGVFSNNQKWFAGDFNIDGWTDMAKAFDDNGRISIEVYLSTSVGFMLERWATQQGIFAPSDQWVVGNFNGDNSPDFAIAKVNKSNKLNLVTDLHVLLNNGSSSFTEQTWAKGRRGYSIDEKWMASDFNEDGKTDLARVYNHEGKGYLPQEKLATISWALSSGSSFGGRGYFDVTIQGNFSAEQKWFAGDFNKDGRTDMAKAFFDNGSASIDVHVKN